jgi:nickel-dependent lactate racemase
MNTTVLPFGQDHRTIHIPDQWYGEIIHPHPVAPAVDVDRLIQEALEHPIRSQRLEDSIKPGQRTAILVDDYTRKTPIHKLLPPILDRLQSAGIRDRDICIVIALGSHRAMNSTELEAKLGAGIIGLYPVVNLISMVKYTAVVFLIAVPDLMGKAKILAGRYFNPIEIYLTVALIYIILVALATWLMRALENKLQTPGLELEVERH